MHILLLSDHIPPESMGGAEKAAWALATGLQQVGHEVSVVAATAGAAFEERRAGIATYHLATTQPIVAQLRPLLERLKPDIVHAHNVHHQLGYRTLSVAHRLGIPTVFTAHDTFSFTYAKLTHWVNPARCGVADPHEYRLPPLYNLRLMRTRYRPVRLLINRLILTHHVKLRIAVSEALRQALAANGMPPFEVVYNGVSAAAPADPAVVAQLQQRWGLAGRFVILVAGRITKDKGSLQLLAALQRLVADVPQAALLVLTAADLAAEGFALSQYQALVTGHVVKGGWLSGAELRAAYQLADVVCVPSVYLDPAPMINLEAMAAAKPLVTTCYGGSPEFVIEGETGLVVNPFATEALVATLRTLYHDPAMRERLAKAAQQHVEARFSIMRQIEETLRRYAQVQMSK